MSHVLIIARHWLDIYGYAGLFGTLFVESFGIPAPGQASLMAAALLAKNGDMNIGSVLITAWIAAFGGDTLGYLIGRRWGQKVLSRLPVSQSVLERVESSYQKYGGLVVLFARFVDGFRQINGIAAGSLGMAWQTFLLFNAAGALLWCTIWGLGLYYAADSIMHAWQWMQLLHIYGWITVGVLLSSGVLLIVYRIWRANNGRNRKMQKGCNDE